MKSTHIRVSARHWDSSQAGNVNSPGSFVGGVGYHRVDVTEIVNNWQKGIEPNYGLMLMSSPENNVTLGGLFYNAGLTPDVPPSIEIKWYEVGDVDRNYPLDDTTINLRPINATDRSGKIEFYGAFWDGIATPGATLEYKLNVESKNYAGSMELGNKFLYPNSTLFQNLFPDGATKYSAVCPTGRQSCRSSILTMILCTPCPPPPLRTALQERPSPVNHS